jgi:hypothetical protein
MPERQARTWIRTGRHVSPNRTRRDPNPELHQQFRGDPFLAPRAIRRSHFRDQLPQFGRQQPEALSMPSNEARSYVINCEQVTVGASILRASHATGASRRSGERGRV